MKVKSSLTKAIAGIKDSIDPYAIEINGLVEYCNTSFENIFSGIDVKKKNYRTLLTFNDDQLNGNKIELVNLKYLLEITPLGDKITGGNILHLTKWDMEQDSPLLSQNLLFQSELKNILSLLVKETSLNLLSEEILTRSANISKSDFGIIIFVEEKGKPQFLIFDPSGYIKNREDLQKALLLNFSFLTTWLNKSNRTLIVTDDANTIGYSLTSLIECKNLLITPANFENKLLGIMITGKMKSEFSAIDRNNIEQFATLLSFAISSIRTRELNSALENRLLQAQKLETIGKLSSGMAHDFNNLLSSIFGSLNLLKKRVEQKEEILKLLDNIENCSIRAKDLTKGLLSFGKPTQKRRELIKPKELVSELAKVVIQTFPKFISLEVSTGESLYDLVGNGTEIYQVLLNLCVNAKEAIEGKGTIKLSANNITIDAENIINNPLLKPGNYVRFTVSDNGSGIAEDHLQKIFDPYFSTKIKDTGSGLGLYVTYGIINAHNGYIDVRSNAEDGTTFEVFIPSFQPADKEKSSSNKIILLADDEIMLRDLLAELLESSDYEVIRTISGVEALEVLTEEIKVDLVIIDYNMPELNGVECVKKIRDLGFTMPVILSTGSIAFAENVELNSLGISSIVAKPYEFETMLATIKKLI